MLAQSVFWTCFDVKMDRASISICVAMVLLIVFMIQATNLIAKVQIVSLSISLSLSHSNIEHNTKTQYPLSHLQQIF